jgi:uncharacterized membrane protein YcaP (DUF421 family)
MPPVGISTMDNSLYALLDSLLGLDTDPHELSFGQMLTRTLVMFVALHQMLRFAPKRFFAARNAIDLILLFLLASIMSRAINGAAAFFPSIAAGFLLVVLYRLLTYVACLSHTWGKWLKGTTVPLIQEGVVDTQAMKRHRISPHDLEQDLRLNGSLEDTKLVRRAVLERNGEISVIRIPRVFTVGVEQGVQQIRIEIEG